MTNFSSLSKSELIVLLAQHQDQLRQQDIALQTQNEAILRLTEERDEYRLAYNHLLQERFRRRSERYIDDPDQLRLDFGDTPEAADAALGLADAVEDLESEDENKGKPRPKKKPKKRNEQLPSHFPRYEVVAELPDDQKNCPTHGERTLLPQSAWDRTESLEWPRPLPRVRVTLYPKYICENYPECGVVTPERPPSLLEGNKYDTSVVAEIITNRYGYHLPYYRLQDYFGGHGWVPHRSTQANILKRAHQVIEPLLEYFRSELRGDSAVACDDTTVTLLYPKELPEFNLEDPKERRAHEVFSAALRKKKPSIDGKMWAYRGVTVKLNLFDFTVSRHRDGPEFFFQDYVGTLLGDCWHGFEAIAVASQGEILRAACNSHARRKFRDSKSYPEDRKQWLRWYGRLYDIEDRGKLMSCEERTALRQEEAKPIWGEIWLWLETVSERTTNVILPKSDMAGAIQYVRNHFTELTRYLNDPHLPMDNNEAEQLMKQVAIGRKNWLFAGSTEGGERTAALLSLVSSAMRNDLDVWAYVKDVLDQMLSGTANYESLLPWNWAAAHPDAIRQYRVEERNSRNELRQAKRADRRTSAPSAS